MKILKNKLFARFIVFVLFILWLITISSFHYIVRWRISQTDTDTKIGFALLRAKTNAIQVPNITSKNEPNTHLGFLKVHKAASTTTQSIFFRFGWRRNLTFVLPPEYNIFGYPNIISTVESVTYFNILPPPSGKTFDILCHHVVYDKKSWESILPADSVLVGTVREPFEHFKSTINYFNPESIANIHTDDPVRTFLKQPMRYENNNIGMSYINNRLAFEYGVDIKVIRERNFDEFDKYLKVVLDKVFSVVIVAEKFDESLIILRRKLIWKLEDILYVAKNVRKDTKPNRYKIAENLKPLHQNFSRFDYLLHDHFSKKLDEQIREEGISFWEELTHFKYVQQYIATFCLSPPLLIQAIRVAGSRWNDVFDVSREDCYVLMMAEIKFTQMIRKRQYGKATWKMPLKEVKRKAHT